MMKFRMVLTKKGAATGRFGKKARAGDEIIALGRKAAFYRLLKWATEAPPQPVKAAPTYSRRDMRAETPTVSPELPADGADVPEIAVLRAEYQTAVGRRPYYGWDAETLRRKIADAPRDGESA